MVDKSEDITYNIFTSREEEIRIEDDISLVLLLRRLL